MPPWVVKSCLIPRPVFGVLTVPYYLEILTKLLFSEEKETSIDIA